MDFSEINTEEWKDTGTWEKLQAQKQTSPQTAEDEIWRETANQGLKNKSTPAVVTPAVAAPPKSASSEKLDLKISDNFVEQPKPPRTTLPIVSFDDTSVKESVTTKAPSGIVEQSTPVGRAPSGIVEQSRRAPQGDFIEQSTPVGRAPLIEQSTPVGRAPLIEQSTPVGRAPQGDFIEQSTPVGRAPLIEQSTSVGRAPRGDFVEQSTPVGRAPSGDFAEQSTPAKQGAPIQKAPTAPSRSEFTEQSTPAFATGPIPEPAMMPTVIRRVAEPQLYFENGGQIRPMVLPLKDGEKIVNVVEYCAKPTVVTDQSLFIMESMVKARRISFVDGVRVSGLVVMRDSDSEIMYGIVNGALCKITIEDGIAHAGCLTEFGGDYQKLLSTGDGKIMLALTSGQTVICKIKNGKLSQRDLLNGIGPYTIGFSTIKKSSVDAITDASGKPISGPPGKRIAALGSERYYF